MMEVIDLFDEYAPTESERADPPAEEHPADHKELVPYLAFISILSLLAPMAASIGESYDTFAMDATGEQSCSSASAASEEDEDGERAMMPYLAFEALARVADGYDVDEPAFPYGAPPTPDPAPPKGPPTDALAPYLEDLDDDDEAAILPYLALAALAHTLFFREDTSFAPTPSAKEDAEAASQAWGFLALPLHAIQFALAPFSATRKGAALNAKKKKLNQSNEDLASLAAQKFFGGGKKQQMRTVRLRTAL